MAASSDHSDPLRAQLDGISRAVQSALRKYRIIYVGYILSLAAFVAACYLEYVGTPEFLSYLQAYHLQEIVFATMVFSVFMLVYFVREQERIRYETQLQEQMRVREGVWIAEQEIRNQIILINQATHVAERRGELTGEMIRVIRDNTQKMEKHLELLQRDNVDPRKIQGLFEEDAPEPMPA
ncbi:MAG: hypothetical protein V1924_01755 [Candidatus Bathyarchaeota archaeon]